MTPRPPERSAIGSPLTCRDSGETRNLTEDTTIFRWEEVISRAVDGQLPALAVIDWSDSAGARMQVNVYALAAEPGRYQLARARLLLD